MAQISSDLANILLAVKTQLLTQNVFGNNCCFITLTTEEINLPPGDIVGLIQPGNQRINQKVVDGTGNFLLWVDGEFSLTIRTRLQLDRTQAVDDWLTNTTLGVIATYDLAINALSQLPLQDPNGNYIIIEPLRFVGAEFASAGKDGRASCSMTFEYTYQQTVQGT